MSASRPFARWAKFNLVGALGMGIQLGALALLNHTWRGHYLLASSAAVEFAVIHNFVWHIHYTWQDRRKHFRLPIQLFRFHLSNGIVSLTGNLLLMRFFVQRLHVPVLLANCVTVLCCSLVNFALSDRWTFRNGEDTSTPAILLPLS